MAIEVEHNVPLVETRGRHPSEENQNLDNMKVGDSFVSSKRREALYQLARSMGIKVRILAENDACTVWRIWKMSDRVKPIPRRRKRRAMNAA